MWIEACIKSALNSSSSSHGEMTRIFLLPSGWDISPSQGYPQYLYTWVTRGKVRATCHAQEHNTMSPAGERTQTARSGFERTNNEVTSPHGFTKLHKIMHVHYNTKSKVFSLFVLLRLVLNNSSLPHSLLSNQKICLKQDNKIYKSLGERLSKEKSG